MLSFNAWKCKQYPQHHQQPSLSLSMIFPLFYCYSSFSIATPSMFGNAHTILKTAPQTSSPTVSTIHLCFCHLPYFIAFSFSIATPSIFGNAHWILKAAPQTSSPTISTIYLSFCDFSYIIAFFT